MATHTTAFRVNRDRADETLHRLKRAGAVILRASLADDDLVLRVELPHPIDIDALLADERNRETRA